MASLTRLLRGGSFTPDGAGGFTFKLGSKFQWDKKKLRKKVGEANAKALKRAGMDVRRAVHKGMSSRQPLGQARQWNIATRGGTSSTAATRRDSKGRYLSGSARRRMEGSVKLVALIRRVPKPDVVTSWRTSKNPKGELRQSIESDYDHSREKVAIGPSAARMRPSVNKTLEFGGTTTHYFVPVRRSPPGRDRTVVYGRLSNSRPKVRGTRIEQAGLYSFTRNVKGRGFMAKGLAKALPKIPERYRNTVTGP